MQAGLRGAEPEVLLPLSSDHATAIAELRTMLDAIEAAMSGLAGSDGACLSPTTRQAILLAGDALDCVDACLRREERVLAGRRALDRALTDVLAQAGFRRVGL